VGHVCCNQRGIRGLNYGMHECRIAWERFQGEMYAWNLKMRFQGKGS